MSCDRVQMQQRSDCRYVLDVSNGLVPRGKWSGLDQLGRSPGRLLEAEIYILGEIKNKTREKLWLEPRIEPETIL